MTILRTTLWWLRQKTCRNYTSQKTPHTLSSRASYVVFIVRIWEKTDRVKTAPHTIENIQKIVKLRQASSSLIEHVEKFDINLTVMELVFFIHDLWFSVSQLGVAMRLMLIQWSTKQSNFIITRSPFSKILTKPSSIGRVWTVPSSSTLQWRHNDHGGVPNHQPHRCLFNRIFRRRSKKISKLRVTGLYAGNSPGPVNSPHNGPVTRKIFPFDDVIMKIWSTYCICHCRTTCQSI